MTGLIKLMLLALVLSLSISINAKTNYPFCNLNIFSTYTYNDSLNIVVSQNSKYLIAGEEIIISIQICSEKERINKISVGGYNLRINENGYASTKFPGGSIGIHTIPIEIYYSDSYNEPKINKYEIKYEVGQASTVIDLYNLNVFYIGIDNLIYVSALAPNDRISLSVSGTSSSIEKIEHETYKIKVREPSEQCFVSVSIDGRIVARKTFRVLNLPTPTASLSGKRSGSRILANELCQSPELNASIDNFPMDIGYKIISYQIEIVQTSGTSQHFKNVGSKLSEEVILHVCKTNPKSTIVINDIIAEEPGGRKIFLPAIVYFIK